MIFQVPQFIDIEDKIFGPFTFKQFLYLAGGAGFVVVMFKLFPIFLALIISTPVAILALALAFLKINNKPFIFTLEAFIKYHTGGKLYLWKKNPNKKSGISNMAPKDSLKNEEIIPSLSGSKLKELSWSLDVLDNSKSKTL